MFDRAPKLVAISARACFTGSGIRSRGFPNREDPWRRRLAGAAQERTEPGCRRGAQWCGRRRGRSRVRAGLARPCVAKVLREQNPHPADSSPRHGAAGTGRFRGLARTEIRPCGFPFVRQLVRAPDVDGTVGRVAVDLGELVRCELERAERGDIRLELLDARGSDQCRRHTASRASVHASASCASDCPRAPRSRSSREPSQRLVRQGSGENESVSGGADASGMPPRYRSVSSPGPAGRSRCSRCPRSQTSSRPSSIQRLNMRVHGLVDQTAAFPARAGCARPRGSSAASSSKSPRTAPCPGGPRCPAHPSSPRAACPGRDRWRVEDVDILEPHAAQALIEAREQVLARSPFAIRARPHVVAGLRRDDHLVAVRREVLAKMRPKFSSAEPGGGP